MSKWAEMTNRERDAALYERTEGLLPQKYEQQPIDCPDGRPGCLVYHSRMVQTVDWESIPHFTTNAADALALAEKMKERKWYYHISCDFDRKDAYFASFQEGYRGNRRCGEGYARADALSLAICEAAWRALGGE